jgi:hypothetical protein
MPRTEIVGYTIRCDICQRTDYHDRGLPDGTAAFQSEEVSPATWATGRLDPGRHRRHRHGTVVRPLPEFPPHVEWDEWIDGSTFTLTTLTVEREEPTPEETDTTSSPAVPSDPIAGHGRFTGDGC